MNMRINQLQAGGNYSGLIPLKHYFERFHMVNADISVQRPGKFFADVETEAEMIRSAQMLIESAKAAQTSLSHLLGEFRDASIK